VFGPNEEFLFSCRPLKKDYLGCVKVGGTIGCPNTGKILCNGLRFKDRDCPGVTSTLPCGIEYDKCD
jgi:hypothetical protein